MNNLKIAYFFLLAIFVFSFSTFRVQAENFSPEQKGEIEKIIREYLIENPNVLMESAQAMQKKRMEGQLQAAIKFISENRDFFIKSKSPVMGNSQGDIILVEFFDYQCGYCKKMEAVVLDLIKENPNLRVILKQLPIFGENSVYAAKATFAANMQDKFENFHKALLTEKNPLTPELVIEYAEKNDLDVEKLKNDMENSDFNSVLSSIRETAGKIQIRGTPYFIFMSTEKDDIYIIAGASTKENMQEIINKLN